MRFDPCFFLPIAAASALGFFTPRARNDLLRAANRLPEPSFGFRLAIPTTSRLGDRHEHREVTH